jgi:hypothetical protein
MVIAGEEKEDIVYAALTHFLSRFARPLDRFVVYPQMSLKWKPQDPKDRRREIPDFGVGNFTPIGHGPKFKLRFGIEAKRTHPRMKILPPPQYIMDIPEIKSAFQTLYFQAQDQAKAAIKNKYFLLPDETVTWILIIGPYWTPVTFGPFSEEELSVRSHKPSPSADWKEQHRMEDQRMEGHWMQELYLLPTPESIARLEKLLADTDEAAGPLIDEMQ